MNRSGRKERGEVRPFESLEVGVPGPLPGEAASRASFFPLAFTHKIGLSASSGLETVSL